MNERRVAAYGGTFDPVHNGHIEVARAVAVNFDVEQLLLIPAYRPPHKDPGAISDSYHRYAMAVLATLEEERLSVSTVEMDSPELPYSVQTVRRLREMYDSDVRLFFVVGADAFEEIGTWREPANLLASTNIIVASRPGYDVPVSHLPAQFRSAIVDLRGSERSVTAALDENRQRSAVYLSDYVRSDVSSTDIRVRVRRGDSIDELVPRQVARYIAKYELYRR
ncbi:MAG TPA: nicotinate-nucleotide adenylyltransferase [Blastocatellia bacterium]|nr:nicotinate-nucleotide adenylyltransferase [Blastocatellia bacterium]